MPLNDSEQYELHVRVMDAKNLNRVIVRRPAAPQAPFRPPAPPHAHTPPAPVPLGAGVTLGALSTTPHATLLLVVTHNPLTVELFGDGAPGAPLQDWGGRALGGAAVGSRDVCPTPTIVRPVPTAKSPNRAPSGIALSQTDHW